MQIKAITKTKKPQFRVGDFVRLKISANQTGLDSPRFHDEVRGQILQINTEACMAEGVQIAYSIRWTKMRGDIAADLIRHMEIELVSSGPFPAGRPETET